MCWRVTIFSLDVTFCILFFFKQFNTKAALVHHSIIQKKMDDMFIDGAFEPSTCGAAFYTNLLVVPKHTGRLWLILNVNDLITICPHLL